MNRRKFFGVVAASGVAAMLPSKEPKLPFMRGERYVLEFPRIEQEAAFMAEVVRERSSRAMQSRDALIQRLIAG